MSFINNNYIEFSKILFKHSSYIWIIFLWIYIFNVIYFKHYEYDDLILRLLHKRSLGNKLSAI